MKTEMKMRNVETEHDVITLHEISELIGDVKDYIYDLRDKLQEYFDGTDSMDALALVFTKLDAELNSADEALDDADEVLAEEFGN